MANNIKVLELQALDLPIFQEVRGKDWVSFGKDNLYPDKIIELYNTSAMNGTAINSITDAVKGEGIVEIGDMIVNQLGETLNDIYAKIALDFVLHNGYVLNVIWNRAGDKIVEIYHLCFDKVRSGKLDENDNVNEYFYSSNWKNTRKYRPVRYKSYDTTDNRGDNASQIYYCFDYTPGNMIYPLPSYVGALNDIQLDARISKYHNGQISNGFSGGIFINLPAGEPTPEEQRIIYRDLVNSFTGEDNAGRLFLSFSEGSELAPQIQSITSANDDYYVTLEERVSSRILTAHRITSGRLIGVSDSNGFSNNAQEIEVAYTHFASTAIEPKQKKINKGLDKIMLGMGVDTKVSIIPSTLDFNKNIDGEV
jgi:hypothetical protein